MENGSERKYELYLRLFRQYFQYIVMIALAYGIYYLKKENEGLRERIIQRMEQEIIDKNDAIEAWRQTKDNDNEILQKLLDKLDRRDAGESKKKND